MALFKSTKSKQQKIQLSCRIQKNVYQKLKDYCDWVGMDPADFITQSVDYVITRDKDYQQTLKTEQQKILQKTGSHSEQAY